VVPEVSLELLAKAVGLMTAAIALLTALVAYRPKRLEGNSARRVLVPSTSGLTVLAIRYAEPRRWPWLLLKWVTLPLGLASVLFGIDSVYLAVTNGSAALALGTFLWAGCAALSGYTFVKLRREPWRLASRVQRSVQVKVQGPFERVFSRCQNALQTVGVLRWWFMQPVV
jgi:hypothetical protein